MTDEFVLIFAKTSHKKTPYDQWLVGTGIKPIILTASEYAASYSHLPEVYAFDNYDKNQLVEKTADEIGKSRNLVAVFARAESDIIRAAILRERLDIEGQDLFSAIAFRNKVIMKDLLKNSGVLLPEYTAIDSAYSIIDFIDKHGYPVVIKPVSESGSLGTHIIRESEDLELYLKNPIQSEIEIENFVAGQMYHIDGLVIEGEIKFIVAFQYVNDCLSFREGRYIGHCSVSPEDPAHAKLITATRKILATLPTPRNTAFHSELWINLKGEVVVCEIASRTGGGMIASLINNSFDVNLDREWFKAECGLPYIHRHCDYIPTGAINIFAKKGTLLNLPSGEPEFVRESHFTGTVGQTYNGGVKSGLFLAGYVIAGKSTDDILLNIETMDQWTEQNFRWDLKGELVL